MASFNNLKEFIEVAVKSRKYPESTAQGLRAAIKLFEVELTDEEAGDLEKFKSSLDQIYNSVFSKNSKKFSAASLATYRSRVIKVLTDYEKYGTDPAKMNSWSPKVITRTRPQPSEQLAKYNQDDVKQLDESQTSISSSSHRIELALRQNEKFILIIPKDITAAESLIVSNILNSLVTRDQDDGRITE